MATAAQCSILHGSFGDDTPRLINGPSVNEPKFGFDVGTAEFFVSSEAIASAGSLNDALVNLGLVRCAQFTDDRLESPLGRFYICDISKSPADGGVNVAITFRGYDKLLPASGCGKFTRLPYSSGLEYTTTGGQGTRITLVRDDGTLFGRFVNQKLTFADPGVGFQDSYIADGRCFDPFDETKKNLTVVGMGTNWGINQTPTTDLKATIITNIGGYIPAGASFGQVPGTKVQVTLVKTGTTTWAGGGWTLSYASGSSEWTLTDGTTTVSRVADKTHGPEGMDYDDGGFSGSGGGDLDAIAGVQPDVDDGFADDTPLNDWLRSNTETPVGQQYGFNWPFVRWRSRIQSQNTKLNNYNLNYGIVLVNREADQACPDPDVDLWHITDTYQTYNQVTLR